MAVPTGRLTFQQIRDLAVRKAGNTQLGVPLSGGPSPATIWLTQILYDLYTLYEWPFLFTTINSMALGPTSFTLPTDFYESQDDQSLIVTSNSGQLQASIVLEKDGGFFWPLVATQATGTVPLYWTADREQGIGFLYPDCTGQTNLAQFRYRHIPNVETTPPPASLFVPGGTGEATINAVIPQFPNSRFLIQSLFVECLQYERDPRYDTEKLVLEQMTKQVLQGLNVLNSQSPVIPLDADVFRRPFRGDGSIGG